MPKLFRTLSEEDRNSFYSHGAEDALTHLARREVHEAVLLATNPVFHPAYREGSANALSIFFSQLAQDADLVATELTETKGAQNARTDSL